MKCPSCGAENQTGKFCAACGAGLDANCAACGTAIPAGARFCAKCGEPVGAARSRSRPGAGGSGGAPATGMPGGSRAAWIIAAAAVVVVLLVVFLPGRANDASAPPRTSLDPAASPAGGGMNGLSTDMRTNADRLFNRIMMAAEQGDQGQVDQFMPMAIQAYGMVENLDDDGMYHLALLQSTAGEHEEARSTALEMLEASPGHILALGVAAQASEALGDADAARRFWERLLEAYPQEAGKPLPEYMDHQTMLTEYRRLASEATSQG